LNGVMTDARYLCGSWASFIAILLWKLILCKYDEFTVAWWCDGC